MNKYQKIELVLSSVSQEYVENNKPASEFVESMDYSVAMKLGKVEAFLNKGARMIFGSNEAYRTYRTKQKNAWNLVKEIRNA